MQTFEYSEIAAFGSQYGYGDYNELIDLMTENRFIPFYERSAREIYVGCGIDYGYDSAFTHLIDDFVRHVGQMSLMSSEPVVVIVG